MKKSYFRFEEGNNPVVVFFVGKIVMPVYIFGVI